MLPLAVKQAVRFGAGDPGDGGVGGASAPPGDGADLGPGDSFAGIDVEVVGA